MRRALTRLLLIGGCIMLVAAGGCAPQSFVRQTSGWKSIELRSELQSDYTAAWEKTVDTIARDYDLEMLDKDSGYMRTGWKHGISGGSVQRYRGRLTVKFPTTKNPERVDIKTEASWYEESAFFKGWVFGYDSRFQRDVIGALTGRLSRTTVSE